MGKPMLDGQAFGGLLAGKNAVVTGAGSGIGRAVAVLLARCGARAALGDVNLGAAEETARLCAEAVHASSAGGGGGQSWIRALQVDCGSAEDIRRFAGEAVHHFARLGGAGSAEPEHWSEARLGRVDVVINNAGVPGSGLLEGGSDELFEETWRQAMDVNVLAQARLVRALLRLRALAADEPSVHGGAVVVNVASTEGLGATLGQAAYVASKHASVGLTRAMALELGARGVRVLCVCPGATRTGMTAPIPEAKKAAYVRTIVPLRRYAEASELAEAIVGLCLPGLSYLHGAIVPVDGGLTANNAPFPKRDWWRGERPETAQISSKL